MDEQTFWDLVDRLGPDPADIDRLVDELSDHGAADIRDFADHLARALHALDTPDHYRAVAASGVSFLGVRCAAVAAGASAYRRVLSAPAALASYTDRPGAHLLPVAERAFRTSTRGDWQHRPEVDTHAVPLPKPGLSVGGAVPLPKPGLSVGGAVPLPKPGLSVGGAVPPPTPGPSVGGAWLRPHMGTTDEGSAPQDYMIALRHVALTLDADPAWRAWWGRSGLAACELGIVAEGRLDHLRPSADIRRCGDRLRANFTCALPGEGADLASRAATEVRGMFEVIRQAMSMPGLPPTPPVPTLPPNVPQVPLTTKPLPELPAELEQQGYLTLTQIQEFFG
ncbi:DUF4240 domain-containing protein [Actinoplanes subtropicus]|uniref:DUF4240 domain-containing protein n=1 Tax=Actinoplanes subtropicus TaxID=543632 RepID=UPI0009FCBE28|nr:DUF4240 domain-containing protein [Actinoplanes subtropicus]